MADPFADVRRRHPSIPQDPLPLKLPDASGRAAEPTRGTGSRPSVRFTMCPHCVKDKPTGVVREDDGSEVFRAHNKVLTTGRRIRCSGSGKEAPP